ncbi:hypothetical protein ACQEU5_19450 [Marinactinospora thermotolerans]|uniref:Uncharacterized protein n=1 Tax=Marinactinospora thermotolerans DSM 45154 TaxID=1122192 RepID=A0A1T4NML6_9ACTN|nr:hypothetical protein [Marinactinospora thermotolerans]SJZ80442.1 hypothetical protein SAMN02745673_01509 [Marinactinospora thermotolerans DSM 45154]
MNTTSQDATWLFPGRGAERPTHPHGLAEPIRDSGARPAPLVVGTLGFDHGATTRVVTQAGGAWNRYTSNDHAP